MKKKLQTNKENQARTPAKPARRRDGTMNTTASGDAQDIIELILRDHKPLKDLIENLKNADLQRSDKEEFFEQFVPLLVSHARAEERSLYVQLKETKGLRTEGYEGDTEHAIAEQLVHEINGTPDDDEWNAKVKVLAELVETHIEEEENEILAKVDAQMDLPTRQALGEIYMNFKMELDILFRPRPVPPSRIVEHRLT